MARAMCEIITTTRTPHLSAQPNGPMGMVRLAGRDVRIRRGEETSDKVVISVSGFQSDDEIMIAFHQEIAMALNQPLG